MSTTINIASHTFPITEVYASHAESPDINALAALDYYRGEKIRKKAFARYGKIRDRESRRVLSEAGVAELAAYVAKLDAEMRFERNMGTEERRGLAKPAQRAELAGDDDEPDGTWGTGESPFTLPSPLPGTLHHELRRLVEIRLAAELTARGIGELPPEKYHAAILALEAEPSLREQARARVEANLEERERFLRELGAERGGEL